MSWPPCRTRLWTRALPASTEIDADEYENHPISGVPRHLHAAQHFAARQRGLAGERASLAYPEFDAAQRLASGANVSRARDSVKLPGDVVRIEERTGDEAEPFELGMGAGFARSVRSAEDDELPGWHQPPSAELDVFPRQRPAFRDRAEVALGAFQERLAIAPDNHRFATCELLRPEPLAPRLKRDGYGYRFP